RPPGGDRRLPRPGAYGAGDGLGPHRRPLRRPRLRPAVPRRRAAAAGAAAPPMQSSPLLTSHRGALLAKLGREAEARAEFERAAALTRNARERDVLLARAAACGPAGGGGGRGAGPGGVPRGGRGVDERPPGPSEAPPGPRRRRARLRVATAGGLEEGGPGGSGTSQRAGHAAG